MPSSLPDEHVPQLRRRSFEEAAAPAAPMSSSVSFRSISPARSGLQAKLGLASVARRTLGICLLLVTVFLWTLCNFLASFIFSDHTYNKPFFLVYSSTSIFAISIVPTFTKYMWRSGIQGVRNDAAHLWHEQRHGKVPARVMVRDTDDISESGERLLVDDDGGFKSTSEVEDKLSFRETAVLSFEFFLLWFFANYFAAASLEYTSVASATILTSTSSVWTLVFCALVGLESFTVRKLLGVLASLVGIVLISTVDLTGDGDKDNGSFPDKTPGQIAIGDAMAFMSAIVYGVYVTVMKKRMGSEDRVDMRLFFGLVGVFNLVFLWPLFFLLHWTGLETFGLPPTGQIWLIILASAISSFVADISWAFAMLLTTPLVVTVGLSLTIPLSLIGEMIQYGKYSSFVYWIGAAVVLSSFAFVNHESTEETAKTGDDADAHDGHLSAA